jgi:hypothetical protein
MSKYIDPQQRNENRSKIIRGWSVRTASPSTVLSPTEIAGRATRMRMPLTRAATRHNAQ